MRGTFALVLGVAVALAAGVMLWDDGSGADAGGDAAVEASGGVDVTRVANDSPATDDEGATARTATKGADRATAAAAIVDELLADGREEDAARALLREETGVLVNADVRRRLFKIAGGLTNGGDTDSARLRRRLLARRLYAVLYDCDATSRTERDAALAACQGLHAKLLFGSGAPDELVLRHKVRSGELLWNLSRGPWRQAGITVANGFVLHVNGISDARRVNAGRTLRVPRDELSLLVRKSGFELTVLLGGAPIERFDIGIGSEGSTPSGSFVIRTRLENPDWYFDGRKIPFGDPENVIGTRWMGFDGEADARAEGIGIHGTSDEGTVGQAVSAGCVRMRRRDVERLFQWTKAGTRVDVRD